MTLLKHSKSSKRPYSFADFEQCADLQKTPGSARLLDLFPEGGDLFENGPGWRAMHQPNEWSPWLECHRFLTSLLRDLIPNRIRIIVQLVVVASMVILVDQVLRAYAYDVSKELSIFIGLIITNCIVMGRLEAFALGNGVWRSFLDGFGNAAAYGFILILVAFVRELFGSGNLLGIPVIPEFIYEMGYENNGFMLLSPMALIIVGVIIWIQRSRNRTLIEKG